MPARPFTEPVDPSFAATDQVQLGALTETAPATDTASSGLNGRLQRIAQRLTSLIALLPASLTALGFLKTADMGAGWTSVFGVSGARYTSADRSGSAASITDAPTSGQKLVITDVVISVDTAMRVDLKEETSGTVLASIYMAANSAQQFTPRSKLKLATADKKLQLQTSVAGNVAATAFYFSEA
jgi:hypothetical protein